jgi:hypothetical protein
MPSKSKAQYKLMQIASYNKDFAENRGIDMDAAKEWHAEDKKKEKEDPAWFNKLPEKAESETAKKKKKKKRKKRTAALSTESRKIYDLLGWGQATPSMEGGLISKLVGIFKSVEDQDKDPEELGKLSRDPKLFTGDDLKAGKINIGKAASHLCMPNFSGSWLNDLEAGVKEVNDYFQKFTKARGAYSVALERIYNKCKTMEPKAALEYAKGAVEAEKTKLDKVAPPVFKHTNLTSNLAGEHGYKFEKKGEGVGPSEIDALTEPELRKAIALLDQLFEIDVWSFDADEDYWTLDDTDDYRWWDHNHPDDEAVWGKLLNLFPAAGEYFEYDYEKWINPMIESRRNGLLSIIRSSVK